MEIRVMDSATAAGLLGVTDRAIRKQISQGKLKTEAMRGSKGGGNCGMSNMIPVSEVLQQLDTQGRLLWYESQSGLNRSRAYRTASAKLRRGTWMRRGVITKRFALSWTTRRTA